MTTNEPPFSATATPLMPSDHRLPTLVQNRARERQLSFWCAAKLHRQEPYSVAMLIREHFPDLASWRIDFMASDISQGVLGTRRGGHLLHLGSQSRSSCRYLPKYFESTPTAGRSKNDSPGWSLFGNQFDPGWPTLMMHRMWFYPERHDLFDMHNSVLGRGSPCGRGSHCSARRALRLRRCF